MRGEHTNEHGKRMQAQSKIATQMRERMDAVSYDVFTPRERRQGDYSAEQLEMARAISRRAARKR